MALPKDGGETGSGGGGSQLGKEGLEYITSFLARVMGQGAVVQTDADSVSSAGSHSDPPPDTANARAGSVVDADADSDADEGARGSSASASATAPSSVLAEVLREEDEIARRLPRSMAKLSEADWQFPLADVQMGAVIATPGSFSKISRAAYQGRTVCVKEVLVQDEVYAITEITVLRNLRHAGILELIGASLERAAAGSPAKIVAVLEFMEGGSLSDALRADKAAASLLPWPHRLSVAAQVAHALEFIHAHGVMHRDVKPDNVLLSATPRALARMPPDQVRAKLADFGMARGVYGRAEVQEGRALEPAHKARHSTRARRQTICGTEAYMAPEMLFSAPYTTSVDVFALGGLLAEVASGRECGKAGFLLRDPADGFSMQLPQVEAAAAPRCPLSLVRLAQQCLAYEAGERPTPGAAAEWLDDLCKDAGGKLERVTAAGRKQAQRTMAQAAQQKQLARSPMSIPAIANGPARSGQVNASGGCCIVQ